MAQRDYYEVLGLDKTADADAIKRAYRQLAKKYHPNLNPGNAEAEKNFKEVNEAYSVLSDADKKAKYDQFGHAGVDPNFGAGAGGGLTMYTTKDACCGIALKDGSIRVFDQHKPLLKKKFNTRDWPSDSIFFKLRYYDHSVSHWYSADGENWTKLNICAYVAVYCAHANYHTWLRPGVFAYGDGEITVKSFEIKEIEGPKF